MIENSMQSGQIFTYQERLKETEENNAELRKILRRYSKGDKLTKSPFAKLESWKKLLNSIFMKNSVFCKSDFIWVIFWITHFSIPKHYLARKMYLILTTSLKHFLYMRNYTDFLFCNTAPTTAFKTAVFNFVLDFVEWRPVDVE